MRVIGIILLFACLPGASQLVEQEQLTMGSKFLLDSRVLDEKREIWVSLPRSYHQATHKYPVILVLDAEYLFDITRSIVRIKSSRNEMPESIVVGIPNNTGKRYDMAMTLTFPSGQPFFSGMEAERIDDYLAFLREEVLAEMDEKFRTNAHRSVIGMSPTFGPVLEAFWNQADLFSGYMVLAAELSLVTPSGATIAELIREAIQDENRRAASIYVGKASKDLMNRPPEEEKAFEEVNHQLALRSNPNIRYRIEILASENHYGMAIQGIERGLETIHSAEQWQIPYKDFVKAESPANAIRQFYSQLSAELGYEVFPLEDSFNYWHTLPGVFRRLKSRGREKEALEVVELGLEYYPFSAPLKALKASYSPSE